MGKRFVLMKKYRLTSLGRNVAILAALIIALTANEIVKSKNLHSFPVKNQNKIPVEDIVKDKGIVNPIINGGINKYNEPVLVINFDINTSTVNPVNYEPLDLLANILKRYGNFNLEIKGYCSREPSSENEVFNQLLSTARAESIKDYLVLKGISPDKITIGGYGYSNPIGDNSTSQGRDINRRVEIYIKSKL